MSYHQQCQLGRAYAAGGSGARVTVAGRANLQRGGEGSGEQCQVSNWPSWHLFTNHSLPLNTVACWTSDGRCTGGQKEELQRDGRAVFGPVAMHYCVEVV